MKFQIPLGFLCPLLHTQESSAPYLNIWLGQTTDCQRAFSTCCSVQGWDGTALPHLHPHHLPPPTLSSVSWASSQHTLSFLCWWRLLFCGYRRDCKQGSESKEAVTSLWGGHGEVWGLSFQECCQPLLLLPCLPFFLTCIWCLPRGY